MHDIVIGILRHTCVLRNANKIHNDYFRAYKICRVHTSRYIFD